MSGIMSICNDIFSKFKRVNESEIIVIWGKKTYEKHRT